ncbi:MAG: hypothetical protein HY077_07025 [Elusimicrobia bacterium]|nr:hypothetical protein [Elusimicrobiota bacterium]
MTRIPAALFALALAVPALAQTPEAMKSATLGSSLQAVLDAGIPPAPQARASAPVYNAQTRSYAQGGFTYESDALNASNSAQANLRNAGLKVLRVENTRQNGGSWNYGFRIEYFEVNNPLGNPRSVATTSNGDYNWDSDAKNGLANEENNLRARGYAIVLGETLKRSAWPYRYYYRIAYAANGQPAPAGLYTSGVYNAAWEAQNGVNAYVADITRKGYRVWDERIYRDPSTRWYFFQLRYSRQQPVPRPQPRPLPPQPQR